MKKQDISALLRRELQAVKNERQIARSSDGARAARDAVKLFQSRRMARTHADLLAAPSSHAAARFFLDDLYGIKDMTQRDTDIERIIPTMERLLPAPALAAITEAIVLDAMSESLDTAMASCLGDAVDEERYVAAYRDVTTPEARARQLAHVQSLGDSLCQLVRTPLLGATLMMMRGPAELAGLSDLHSFLHQGFSAFKAMRDPRAFVSTIVSRETLIMKNLFDGLPEPFLLERK
ncbi:MAG: hypothetical protein H7315_19305 [Herminiimonas sp.]|nr:hypothetical protein [Herminiimonas sp.]